MSSTESPLIQMFIRLLINECHLKNVKHSLTWEMIVVVVVHFVVVVMGWSAYVHDVN